ncbi:ANTAR domain-containing response regulator [Chromohalobacter israelensis]|uniref:Response regulator receiver (CheY-like) and ANTAR domain protein n=1 Tax=Chromohalobacter israelensis (strain ATCC BAA-138 / DSM 3043 / CIP 106854 / NCIMB 13768 / 1H11) TaxID=290398 RepID=Q1R135_CHRI1|nr:ANTAR domain-containing protein [Chromohalobacter salexigens]ABE57573.1 response regulator receiver (CheY-like) and ANTAR domain protein [Chromohalobacter salexigens DSM 3043]
MNAEPLTPRLLLVDCEPRSQAMLDKSLARLGLHGWAVIEDAEIALTNVDGVIVELDHFASPRLLEAARVAGLPIVAMTHHQTLSQIQRARRLGATAILNKPITQHTVYTTLAMARTLRERLTELEAAHDRLTVQLDHQGLIARAVARIMVSSDLDEAQAFERLRSDAMSRQLTLVQASERLLAQMAPARRQGGPS